MIFFAAACNCYLRANPLPNCEGWRRDLRFYFLTSYRLSQVPIDRFT